MLQSGTGQHNNNNPSAADLARQHMEDQLEKHRAKEKGEVVASAGVTQKPYQLVVISILREYLALEMRAPVGACPFAFGSARVIDDYVFLCFFVGNDFLPHMPTLEIREGAIDLLMNVYKRTLPRLGGYLTKGRRVHLARVEKFIEVVSASLTHSCELRTCPTIFLRLLHRPSPAFRVGFLVRLQDFF